MVRKLKLPKIIPIDILAKNNIVGLDIGSSSVKLAHFIRGEEGLRLVRVDIEELDPEKNEANRQKELVLRLEKLLVGIDCKKTKFVVVIDCPRCAVKRVTAPHMPKGELRKGIKLEAKDYFPFPISDAVLDFEILGETIDKGIKKYKLLVAASPNETVQSYLSLLNSIDIKPFAFINTASALQNLVKNSTPKEGEVKAILDMGSRFSELSIFMGANLVFSRKIPVAGSDFTKAMTVALASESGKIELSLSEAEKIKKEVGIPAKDDIRMIENKISTTHISSMLRASMEQLADEIARCFDYYRETGGGRVEKLLLLGNESSMKGLPAFLSEELGLEVKFADPLTGVKTDPGLSINKEKVSHQIGLAIGAGLSEGKGINLLPPELKEEVKRTVKRTGFETMAVTVVLVLAFIYIGMRIQLGNYEKRIGVAKMELSSLKPQLKVASTQELVSAILQKEPYWEDVFRELSNIIPVDIYLTQLGLESGAMKMKGIVLSEDAEGRLSDFIRILEKGLFKNVKLVATRDLRNKVGNEFELTCLVD